MHIAVIEKDMLAVTGVRLSEIGHIVTCIDIDEAKV